MVDLYQGMAVLLSEGCNLSSPKNEFKTLFPGDKSVASSVDGEESVVGCDNRHYVDQTTLNVARGGREGLGGYN